MTHSDAPAPPPDLQSTESRPRSEISDRERVRQFIVNNFYLTDASSLSDDSSLLREGVVDSTGVLEVINFLEREFGIQIRDEEMLPDNLDSISNIAAFIACKRGPVPGG